MPDQKDNLTLFKAGAQTAVAFAEQVTAPFNCDIDNVTLTAGTGPVGSNLIVDVLDGGTSVFATAIATLVNAVGTTDTALTVTQNAGMSIPRKNQILLIGTEMVQVTDIQGAPGQSAGTAQGTQTAVSPEYTLTVTRNYGGSSAATHAAGVAVSPAKPQIVAGSTSTGTAVFAPSKGASGTSGAPPISEGDVLSVAVTQIGSGTAGSDLTVEIEVTQR